MNAVPAASDEYKAELTAALNEIKSVISEPQPSRSVHKNIQITDNVTLCVENNHCTEFQHTIDFLLLVEHALIGGETDPHTDDLDEIPNIVNSIKQITKEELHYTGDYLLFSGAEKLRSHNVYRGWVEYGQSTPPNQRPQRDQQQPQDQDRTQHHKSPESEYSDEIEVYNEVRKKGPEGRLLGFAKKAHKAVVRQEIKDPDEIKAYCSNYATESIVGTGGVMDINTVLEELAEFTELIRPLQLPEHGGNEDAVDAISGNSINFQHNAYFALQTFYEKAVYGLVIDKMDIFNTERVLDDPISQDVFYHFN